MTRSAQSNMESAKILSIQVGLPKTLRHEAFPDDEERAWTTGIFKEVVSGPVRLGRENFEGDGQADREHHGGGDRAVLIFSRLHYPGWEQELGKPLDHGSFGENLTVDTLTEDDVCLGDVWETEAVSLEISQPRLPCFKLARRLGAHGANVKVMEAMAGGWYCRTLREGQVEAGQTLRLTSRPHPEWTIRRAFHQFVFEKENAPALAQLAQLSALSELWRDRLEQRLQKVQPAQ